MTPTSGWSVEIEKPVQYSGGKKMQKFHLRGSLTQAGPVVYHLCLPGDGKKFASFRDAEEFVEEIRPICEDELRIIFVQDVVIHSNSR
jgi:hypothetical protein